MIFLFHGSYQFYNDNIIVQCKISLEKKTINHIAEEISHLIKLRLFYSIYNIWYCYKTVILICNNRITKIINAHDSNCFKILFHRQTCFCIEEGKTTNNTKRYFYNDMYVRL